MKQVLIQVKMPEDLVEKMDQFVADQKKILRMGYTRSDFIRLACFDRLLQEGYVFE